MSKLFARFLKDESGATAVEYGLIVALIAAAIITTVGLIGDQISSAFEKVRQGLDAEGF